MNDEDVRALKEEVDKLQTLLKDPQPRLSTWQQFLADRMDRLVNIYYAKPTSFQRIAAEKGLY